MEINKHIIFKGQKLPLVCTPITKKELLELQNTYDKFLLQNSSNGRIIVISNERKLISHSFNVGFQPIFYSLVSIFVIYKVLSTSKKIKNKIKSPINRKSDEELNEFINSMKRPTPKNGKINEEVKSK
jgi:hypothetical protein